MSAPFGPLTPDFILTAVEASGLCCDGRLLTLNSYENRVYQVGIEDAAPLIAKFYRPGRWSDEAILEEHAFLAELAEAEIPAVPALEIDGKTLRAGDRVFGFANAANRDPRAFTDPQGLDLGRTPNRHLTFGFGTHFCMGAPLARLEGQRCVGRLVQRFASIRRAPGEPDWVDALTMRGVFTLPVILN